MKKTVLFFHDNNLNSGATKSLNDWLMHSNPNNYVCIFPYIKGNARKTLRKKGFECHHSYYSNITVNIKNNNIIFILKYIIRTIQLIISIIVSLKLIRVLYKCNIIYSNSSSIYTGYILSALFKKKHIWHLREFGILDYKWKRIFDTFIFRKSILSSTNIAISKSISNFYRTRYSINNIHIVYDDVSSEYIVPKREYSNFNKILIAGNLVEGKGQLEVIKAVHAVNVKYNFNYQLYIAGDSNSAYKITCKNYCKKNNCEDYIHFLGALDDLSHIRKDCDISIVSSKNEGFGRVTIESMLSRLLVLGLDNAGTQELIIDKTTGFLFPAESFIVDVSTFLVLLKQNFYTEKYLLDIIECAYKYALNFTTGSCGALIETIIQEA